MSYSVKQPSIFGRIGTGIGKGLAEQVPKEIERSRLAAGLKELGTKRGLSPFQQFAELSGIPGITPQMIQSGSELLKQQALREAFGTPENPESVPQQTPQSIQQQNQIASGISPAQKAAMGAERGAREIRPSDFATEEEKALFEPSAPEKSPFAEQLIPRKKWTEEKRRQEIGKTQKQFPMLPQDKIEELVASKEERELAQPEAEQKIFEYEDTKRKEADAEFDRQLQIKLQKKGEETFKDLPGPMQLSLKKGMIKDLIQNPRMSKEQAADKWSEIGLNNAKALNQLNELSSQSIFHSLPSTKLDKIKSLQKPFAQAGNKESFQSYLERDFEMSPQRAAQVAYPVSNKIKSFIENSKRSSSIPEKYRQESRAKAIQIENLINSEQSLLSIARSFKDHDPYFDERSFFQQLRDDEEELGLSPRQGIELGKGESAFFPHWADLYYFPFPHGIKKGPIEK